MFGILLACCLAPTPTITVESLCRDMVNLPGLCEYPSPPYETRQASSYDRASVSPDKDTWFANGDAGNFLRDEDHNGRKEHVMVDVKGPGVVVRYWSPNPAGITRFYIDGSDAPALEAKTVDLLGGKFAPFLPPVSESTSSGWSLYYPITYQKSLKVTVDDTDTPGGHMYYHIQYRTYDPSVVLEPFRIEEVKALRPDRQLAAIPALPMLGSSMVKATKLLPGADFAIDLKGPKVIEPLIVMVGNGQAKAQWDSPEAWHNILRSVRVLATFDGGLCVDAPLGDLFCTTIGLNPLQSLPAEVASNGTLVLNLPMPFKDSAHLVFRNEGEAIVDLRVATPTRPYVWTDRSMHFMAQWLCYDGKTRPMRDLEFLHTKGKGVYVGCNVGISNPVPDWWGEGDEKIYLDGESFPSTFGTGTEDFFGYGWSNPALFQHPYHFQSRCDGPGTKGHSCIGRWQILDRLPFEKQFRFDIELWHWADVQMAYSRTVYWYARPGSDGPKSDKGTEHLPRFIEGPKRVLGAQEGEECPVAEKTGGVAETQGFDNLSAGKQLWWRDAKVGDRLVLRIPVEAKGRYHVYGRFCFAVDYGIQRIRFGSIDRTLDFYDQLKWKTVDLGATDLAAGDNLFSVTIEGANARALPNHMFGLDYLMLVKD